MPVDLLIRNGTVVREDRVQVADIAIEGEKFVEIGPGLSLQARETVDATGLHVFPGVIDPHVHFNEPGRTDWEGISTGSAALAAGGGTCFFDMPLNSTPPVLDGPSFDAKLEAMKRSSITDFGIWGGLTPNNLDNMEELAERGVVGFKAFMCDSGIEEFPFADDYTLYRGLRIAARLDLLVALHAENQSITKGLTADAIRLGKTSAQDFVSTRPVAAEVEAIRRVASIADEAACRIHIVHVSSREGSTSADRGLNDCDLSHETCPHYLVLEASDMTRLGPCSKCAPPLRTESDQKQLWINLANGIIDFVGSDHSPCTPDLKADPNFFRAWGGISGVQSTLSLLVAEGALKDKLPLDMIASVTSGAVANRFRIAAKGEIAVEKDADLTILNFDSRRALTAADLFYRHKSSPYVGMKVHGMVQRTLVRGATVFQDGNIVGRPIGKLVTPFRAGVH